MTLGLIGKKLGCTQIFDENGNRVTVTVVQAGPCMIVQKKSEDGRDGYNAVKLGFGDASQKQLNKPQQGVFEKARPTLPAKGKARRRGLPLRRHLREFRIVKSDLQGLEVGQELTVDMFERGQYVDVTATSKGRGFAGVMKRFGFKGARATHGTHEFFRHPGSIGSTTYPGRVWKGRKLPGHMGNKRVTTLSLRVAKVDADNNLVMLNGPVPGATGGLVLVRHAVKKQL